MPSNCASIQVQAVKCAGAHVVPPLQHRLLNKFRSHLPGAYVVLHYYMNFKNHHCRQPNYVLSAPYHNGFDHWSWANTMASLWTDQHAKIHTMPCSLINLATLSATSTRPCARHAASRTVQIILSGRASIRASSPSASSTSPARPSISTMHV